MTVFFGSASGIILIALWAILFSTSASTVIGAVVGWVSTHLGWYYFLIVTLVLVFVTYIAISQVGWAVYALMGAALGYFSCRQNRPLSIRSALSPRFGTRIHGSLRHSIDIAAIIGIGVVQLNYGSTFMFGTPQSFFVPLAGSTPFLLDGIVQNLGDAFSRSPGMTLNTFAHDRPDA